MPRTEMIRVTNTPKPFRLQLGVSEIVGIVAAVVIVSCSAITLYRGEWLHQSLNEKASLVVGVLCSLPSCAYLILRRRLWQSDMASDIGGRS